MIDQKIIYPMKTLLFKFKKQNKVIEYRVTFDTCDPYYEEITVDRLKFQFNIDDYEFISVEKEK